jgi:hypothetical protein
MKHSSVIDIKQQVKRYGSGQISRAEYRAWLIERVWNVGEDSETEANRILFELESLDAEYTEEHWTETQLKSELRLRYLSPQPGRASA